MIYSIEAEEAHMNNSAADQAAANVYGREVNGVKPAYRADEVVVAEGVVNGPPLGGDDVTYVPVFAARDNERETTTIYVAEGNILGLADEAGGMGTHDGLGG